MFGSGRAKRRAEVFGELAALVHAGVSVGESVTAVAEELGDTRLGRALAEVGREASRGRSLADGLRRHEGVFSPLTTAMVEIGERSGRIEAALRSVQEYHEKDFELRHLLTRELFYPIILFAAILVIPVVADFIRVWITDTLLAAVVVTLGHLFVYVMLLGVPLTIIAFTVRTMSQSGEGRLRLHRILLSIPIIGGVVRKLSLARFCRALASLYSSGVLLGTSVRLAGEAAGNEAVRRELTRDASKIDSGGTLSDALGQSSLMPDTVLRMLRTGEKTGGIDEMAHNVADHLEQEAETAIKQVAVSLAPAAVIIAGIIVALMVIGFYSNLYSF